MYFIVNSQSEEIQRNCITAQMHLSCRFYIFTYKLFYSLIYFGILNLCKLYNCIICWFNYYFWTNFCELTKFIYSWIFHFMDVPKSTYNIKKWRCDMIATEPTIDQHSNEVDRCNERQLYSLQQ